MALNGRCLSLLQIRHRQSHPSWITSKSLSWRITVKLEGMRVSFHSRLRWKSRPYEVEVRSAPA